MLKDSEREKDRDRDRKMEGWITKQTGRQTDIQTGRQTGRLTSRPRGPLRARDRFTSLVEEGVGEEVIFALTWSKHTTNGQCGETLSLLLLSPPAGGDASTLMFRYPVKSPFSVNSI